MKLSIKLVVVLILIQAFFSQAVMAYEPPVGVPLPNWGGDPIERLAPAHPSAWPAQEAVNYFYIDNLDPNATDRDNPFGYPDKPRLTIPEGNLQAGTYVEIHNGPYTGGGRISIHSLGTQLQPVWIVGDSAAKALIRGETTITGSYLYLENLLFDTSRKTLGVRAYNGQVPDHIVVRNNEFSGPSIADGFTAVLGVYGDSTKSAENIIIYNNHIHGFGDTSPDAPENDYHGIIVQQYADYVWVLNNHIHENGGDSIQIGSASYTDPADPRRPSHIFVADNHFHDDGENAVDIKGADHIVISSNVMYGYGNSTSSAGETVVVHNYPHNVWVINNIIHSAKYGVVVTGATDAWALGNVIYNIHATSYSSWDPASLYSAGAAIHFRGSTNGGAMNNTLYDFDNGIQIATGTGYKFKNNIIAYRAQQAGSDIAISSSLLGTTSIENNLLYHVDGERIRVSSEVYGLSGYCASCSNANPVFTDYANFNFEIENDSPAIDKGNVESESLLLNIASMYNAMTNTDLSGDMRIQGTRIDIGAFESFGTHNETVSVPFAPSALSVELK